MNPHRRIDNPSCCLVTPRHRVASSGSQVRRAATNPAFGRSVPEPAKPEGGWVTATGARQCPADASSSGSGGGRTHSIPGSKPGWSANCLPSRRFVSTQSRDRTCKHPGLSRAALPIGVSGHGRSSPGGIRTPDRLLVRELPSPLGHRTVWQVRVCDRSSRDAYS